MNTIPQGHFTHRPYAFAIGYLNKCSWDKSLMINATMALFSVIITAVAVVIQSAFLSIQLTVLFTAHQLGMCDLDFRKELNKVFNLNKNNKTENEPSEIKRKINIPAESTKHNSLSAKVGCDSKLVKPQENTKEDITDGTQPSRGLLGVLAGLKAGKEKLKKESQDTADKTQTRVSFQNRLLGGLKAGKNNLKKESQDTTDKTQTRVSFQNGLLAGLKGKMNNLKKGSQDTADKTQTRVSFQNGLLAGLKGKMNNLKKGSQDTADKTQTRVSFQNGLLAGLKGKMNNLKKGSDNTADTTKNSGLLGNHENVGLRDHLIGEIYNLRKHFAPGSPNSSSDGGWSPSPAKAVKVKSCPVEDTVKINLFAKVKLGQKSKSAKNRDQKGFPVFSGPSAQRSSKQNPEDSGKTKKLKDKQVRVSHVSKTRKKALQPIDPNLLKPTDHKWW